MCAPVVESLLRTESVCNGVCGCAKIINNNNSTRKPAVPVVNNTTPNASEQTFNCYYEFFFFPILRNLGIFMWTLWHIWVTTYLCDVVNIRKKKKKKGFTEVFLYRYAAYDKCHISRISQTEIRSSVSFIIKRENCRTSVLCGFYL